MNVEIQGCTPVYMATSGNHVRCLQLLLKAGASPECLNYSTPPLFRAAALGNEQCDALLIRAKANLETKFQDMTAVWRGAFNGHLSCVKLLLQAGANRNHLNERGFSAAWAAKSQGYEECFEYIRDFEDGEASYILHENISVTVIPPDSFSAIAQNRNIHFQNRFGQDVTLSAGELLGVSTNQQQNYPQITAGSITIITSDVKMIQSKKKDNI